MKNIGIVVIGFITAGLLLGSDVNAGSLEPPGPPAPTMKTVQQVEPRIPISFVPITIAAPGSYYLTGDLFGVSGQSGITINSSYVTLDLNGFSLIGVGGSIDGIRATFGGTKHVEIRNGVIRGWGSAGINAAVVTEVHLEDLRVDTNVNQGVVVGPRSVVVHTMASGNSSGISADTGSSIIGCTASANGLYGIQTVAQGTVSSSTCINNATSGFVLGAGSAATDCTAQGNATGFNLGSGSRVSHSVAKQNAIGIQGGDGASIEECTVQANTDDGIRVVHRGLIRGNFAWGNTNDGIQAIGNECRIEDNESTQNGAGIRVDGVNSLIVKNSVSGNSFEYLVVGGNKMGAISTDPTTAGPWANFDL